jgi:hypothetical protein
VRPFAEAGRSAEQSDANCGGQQLGIVGLSWYDRRDSPNNLTYSPRFAASLDGGATRKRERPDTKDKHLNGGDTSGLAADADGVFHLVWIDNRTGVSQVWTTTVKVRAIAARSHSPPRGGVRDAWVAHVP